MSLIQVLLIAGTGASLLLYLGYFRTQLRDRLIAFTLFCAAVGVILFPDLTTVVANRLGVMRGADLLFYLFIVFSLFTGILLYSRILGLEQRQTQLVRHLAIRDARAPMDPKRDAA